jgi:hypothetical protein
MPEGRTDEFYVGYLPKAPPNQARHTVIVVLVHLIVGMIVATIVVARMRDPGQGTWDTSRPRDFAGRLVKRPYPLLLDDRGRALLMVDFGKRGAQRRVQSLPDGAHLTVNGFLLDRDGRQMVECSPEESAVRADHLPPAPASLIRSGDRITLVGEIVDSKCFLGAMKPGEGKTHKACAVRCISGGIPPVLVCWDGAGRTTYYLLADTQGGPVGDWVLPLVGEHVEVTGDLAGLGDLRVFCTGPDAIRRR